MPISVKYSHIEKNDILNKNIEVLNTNINVPSTTVCPPNSFLDLENDSPNPIEKPCHCIGKNKWIQTDGSC